MLHLLALARGLNVRAYKITLPTGKTMTMITFEKLDDIPAAVYEKFLVWPVDVVAC